MDNLTHSLVGAALAEVALPKGASTAQRRLFFFVGVVASNLPDADLLYTSVMPAPLGYLLHHRGHTHTLVGIAALAALIALFCLAPRVRSIIAPVRRGFWTLVGVSLLGHLVLDSWNSYGIHPFYPINNRWYYGDAISILEPWLWLLLGTAAVANIRNRYGRGALALLLVAVPLALVRFGWLSLTTVGVLAAGGFVVAWIAWRVTPRSRSVAALMGMGLFVVGMFGVSWVARREVVAAFPPAPGGEIVDVVLTPGAAVPLSWSFIVIEKQERDGAYIQRRGALGLGPPWLRPRAVASRRVDGATKPTRLGAISGWQELRQPLAPLRALSRDDCWVRAWLQFGRAPVLDSAAIADLRFGGPTYGNFTYMSLRAPDEARTCPPRLTQWDMPRADLLSPLR